MTIKIDPVCGTGVNEGVALVQAHLSEREGKRYVFCSMDCKREFDRNPYAYISRLRTGEEEGQPQVRSDLR